MSSQNEPKTKTYRSQKPFLFNVKSCGAFYSNFYDEVVLHQSSFDVITVWWKVIDLDTSIVSALTVSALTYGASKTSKRAACKSGSFNGYTSLTTFFVYLHKKGSHSTWSCI
ncbi:unnamed protein product [Albugo candida]|uniref:Uncharacterized protein n=1 Tax=Albugo candida TaxID=65357 RepID=A0A024GKJ9_9STRA|nr:unnamed protein product [Albugo candida]|eukprot:CCI47259.1 unnamed protein product [Albugo candida]